MKLYLDTSFILAVVIDDAHSESARGSWRAVSAGAVVGNLASIECRTEETLFIKRLDEEFFDQ